MATQACHLMATFRVFLELPTARPQSLAMLLQLKMQCAPPSTLGFCSCPRAHTRNPYPVTRVGGNPAPAAKTTLTDTASPLKTYLKERDAAHQEGLLKESIFETRLSGPRIGLLHLTFSPASDKVTSYIWKVLSIKFKKMVYQLI